MKYIDTHVHLVKESYKDNLKQNINSALSELEFVINISYNKETSIEIFEQLDKIKNMYGAIGLHPSYCNNFTSKDLLIIKELLEKRNPKVIAIGEIGLDYFREHNLESQKKAFVEQIELAIDNNLPVIVHTRSSIVDTLNIIKNYPSVKFLLHSWSGDVEQTNKALKMNNIYFSFNGIITFKSADSIRESLEIIPIEKVLIETDCPWLSPVPLRGKINIPENVKYVYEKISELKNIDLELLTIRIKENVTNFFNI